MDDLLASLAGGKTFTKLDLAHAYLQIPLDEQSKKYTTINTHKGLSIKIPNGSGRKTRNIRLERTENYLHLHIYLFILTQRRSWFSLAMHRPMGWEQYCLTLGRMVVRDRYTSHHDHLVAAERNYSQLDKEGLAIIFPVKKFHQFIYGRSFVIESDHKPLQSIFGHTRPVPPIASARLQRWALALGHTSTVLYINQEQRFVIQMG